MSPDYVCSQFNLMIHDSWPCSMQYSKLKKNAQDYPIFEKQNLSKLQLVGRDLEWSEVDRELAAVDHNLFQLIF